MLAVDSLIGRIYKSKALVQFIIRTTFQEAYMVAWTDLNQRTTYYAAILSGGKPGAFVWDLERYQPAA